MFCAKEIVEHAVSIAANKIRFTSTPSWDTELLRLAIRGWAHAASRMTRTQDQLGATSNAIRLTVTRTLSELARAGSAVRLQGRSDDRDWARAISPRALAITYLCVFGFEAVIVGMSKIIDCLVSKLCLKVGHSKVSCTCARIHGLGSHTTMLSLTLLMVQPPPLRPGHYTLPDPQVEDAY